MQKQLLVLLCGNEGLTSAAPASVLLLGAHEGLPAVLLVLHWHSIV